MAIYGTKYRFYFKDEQNHTYRTPEQPIDTFALVTNEEQEPALKIYSQGVKKKTATLPSPVHRADDADLESIKAMLDKEIARLKEVVAPKMLEGLIEIQRMLNQSIKNDHSPVPSENGPSTEHVPSGSSVKMSIFECLLNASLANAGLDPNSEDAKLAKKYAKDTFNPFKTEKDLQEDIDAIVRRIVNP